MRKVIFLTGVIALTMSGTALNAQVTIGEDKIPETFSVLELISENNSGLRLPQIESSAMRDAVFTNAAGFKGNQLANGLTIYNMETKCIEYWDGNKWVKAEAVEPWMIAGTTNTAAKDNTDNIYQMGSVGIGTANPDTSAILELKASNKGFLGPRVALQSITDQVTIPNPALGLLAFNTGTADLKYVGYVYWNGQEWISFTSGSLAPGTVGHVICNEVSLTPSVYEAGETYHGVMIVPYTGGNGGTYPAMTIGPVNGLTAALSSGNFSAGSGSLAFTITGTPTVSSPDVTVFPMALGGQTCNATVGVGEGIAAGELVFYKTPDIPANIDGGGNDAVAATGWMSYYANDLPVIGGKLRLDGYFSTSVSGSGTVSFNPRLVNVSGNRVKFWFSAMTTVNNYNSANIVLQPLAWVNLDNGIYNGWGANNTMSNPAIGNITNPGEGNTEIVTLDLSLDDKWYRIYYYPIIDNMEQTLPSGMMRRIYMSIQRLY